MSINEELNEQINETNLNNFVSLETPHLLAFIVDNEVALIISASEMYYSLLMSNPIIKELSPDQLIQNGGTVFMGSTYDPSTDTFLPPQ